MKRNVCVITGGGSGMGLEAAKCMPKDKIIVLAGRTVANAMTRLNTGEISDTPAISALSPS